MRKKRDEKTGDTQMINKIVSENTVTDSKFVVQISYVTRNGGRTTTTETINAQNENDARKQAEQIIEKKYNQGRIVSVGKR